MNAILATLQQATNAARARTGDNRIGVAVKNGEFQVQQITQRKGMPPLIEPLSGWRSFVAILDVLAALR